MRLRELFKQMRPKNREIACSRFCRKGPSKIMAERRLVYDNDHQATDLISKLPPRWQSAVASSWKSDDLRKPKRFEATESGESTSWPSPLSSALGSARGIAPARGSN